VGRRKNDMIEIGFLSKMVLNLLILIVRPYEKGSGEFRDAYEVQLLT
jgi:hypothetical protein